MHSSCCSEEPIILYSMMVYVWNCDGMVIFGKQIMNVSKLHRHCVIFINQISKYKNTVVGVTTSLENLET